MKDKTMIGEQWENVPVRQVMKIYLCGCWGKEVAWVSHTDGGHCIVVPAVKEVND